MKIMTGYSFYHSTGHPEEVMARLKEINYPCAPISDFCSTFGFVRWRKLAKKAEMRPIYGVTIPVSHGIGDKKPPSAEFTFYAKNSLEELNSIIGLATNQFRYTPLLTYEQVNNFEDVIIIAGYRAQLHLLDVRDNVYVGLSPALSKGQFNRAREKGFRFIASSENRYTNKGDRVLFETIGGINASTQSWPQHILDDEEWRASLYKTEASQEEAEMARQNMVAAMAECVAELPMGNLLEPKKEKTLRQLCEEGAARLGCDLSDEVYAARLDRELTLIDEKGFENYFYIVSEMIMWSKQYMLVGPGRGSSSGSLVCYLLGITEIDPIPYGLLFERFIDINRLDLPDIDIDFSATRRELAFKHMEETYGKERIARLGTVALYKPTSVIKESGAAMDVPFWKTNPVLDSMIETSSGDARALRAVEDTLMLTPAGRTLMEEFPEMEIAKRVEGHPKNKGQHAAGILVTDKPVRQYVAIDSVTGATHCDKKDAEELNLLKIDALGLVQLSIFEDCLEAVGKPREWLSTIPLDDPKAFKIFNDRKFSGIFQFEGDAVQRVTKEVVIAHIDDIIALGALARPGPLSSGSTAHWIKRKNGKEPASIPHEVFEPYLKETYGVVVYQEQIMSIVREVGGLSWEDTSNLRKAMSKSLGREYFDQFGNPFKAECIRKGVPEQVAYDLWDGLCAFGAWCFNKSHAVAYGLISYQCAYLKAHYPLEYAAAVLTHQDQVDKQLSTLRELFMEGIPYVPVDKKHSTDKWRVAEVNGQSNLIGPLQNVVGIGPKLVPEILNARARGLPLPARADKLLSNPTTKIDSLFPISDAFRRVMPDPSERNIHTRPTPIVKVQVTGEEYEVLVFCVLGKINPKDENEDINVHKRGYAVRGPRYSLGLHLVDDTDNIYAKVNRFDYEKLAKSIINRGRANKALYAIKGTVPRDFRMINIQMVRYIGDIDTKYDEIEFAKREAANEQRMKEEADAGRTDTGENVQGDVQNVGQSRSLLGTA
jgi:DNA polymerase III alpha subunit